ncbi:hypothetical protein [Paraburkholderia phytofirmans]|nr:hypothetical protein [Paraburkholderia phytofirmans]
MATTLGFALSKRTKVYIAASYQNLGGADPGTPFSSAYPDQPGLCLRVGG